ncbi:DUF2254 domain-containing protein [Nitrosomonas halophila]|uniref:Uncharacterized membrane protein n=1 Tax=Nitrosomonas halophila TaxID=44576 RepID=A0A1H3PT42_9PROT|nr:DUF2254 domain-containing protein [Nitrosomonas halophila]SDZ04045.1 Uncharacterized membrane protein [Nitrosomonas halophila]
MILSRDRLRFLLSRVRERLWVKPLLICLLSILGVFSARLMDTIPLVQHIVIIKADTIAALLSIMASSMLVIATFAVASMVSAYASASSTATPRSFSLVIADDVSQNALSTFIGAFIFSIVSLAAVKNNYFEEDGLFALFLLMALVFALVIVTFVRWVDRIARLGRLGSTIDKVEQVTAEALTRLRNAPLLGGVPVATQPIAGEPVYATEVGYLQQVGVAALQAYAEQIQGRVVVMALPGAFVTPSLALAYVCIGSGASADRHHRQVVEAFQFGSTRLFNDDPRFGLIVLSEIASRALSPAVNDPGTAIDVIGRLVRLFVYWSGQTRGEDAEEPLYDRVSVPTISVHDMFDDAFTAIARDGAGLVEVAVRLQKAFHALAMENDTDLRQAAKQHSRLALKRAEKAITLAADRARVRRAARW